ncbi:MAG: response regulator [Lachnospiraceae bacterium]|nr:response regulator [Lachnospiraceae bacterium]
MVTKGKTFLFVSSGSSFLINAVYTNLVNADFNVVRSGASVRELSDHKDEAEVIILYLDEGVYSDSEVLIYLKDMCLEKDMPMIIIGDNDGFRAVETVIPERIVVGKFVRPIDIKQFVSHLEEFSEEFEEAIKHKTILLVDDDGDFLKMVRSWLSEMYRVIMVNSGMQAITYLATNKHDLILLDYEMPITTGEQVMKMIRSEPTTRDIPIIFLTGKGDRENVTKLLSLKPDGYILKSSNRFTLVDAIDRFFEKQK